MSEPMTTAPEHQVVNHRPQAAAVVRGEVPVEDMIKFLDSAFTVLRAAVDAAAIAPTGPMYSRYDTELEGDVRVEAGVPVLAELEGPMEFNGVTIEPGELPGGEVATSTHAGPYSELRGVWQDFLGGIGRAGREPRKPYVEQYLVAPADATDKHHLRTELIAHLKG